MNDKKFLGGVKSGAIQSNYQPGLNFMGKGHGRRKGADDAKYAEGYAEAFGKKYGYAPGDYRCKCQRCGDEFDGDKRAYRCKRCAERVKELNG